MGTVSVVNCRNGRVFLSDLREARSPWRKLAGLMFLPSIDAGRGLLFRPGRGIHTHFMRFALDLIYLDEAQRVSAVRAAMPPWRHDWRLAAAVIEASAGTISAADIRVGDQVRFEPV